ncbi:MAG TPA: CHAD domain-containing protein [Actinomycetota bacterium]
MTSGPEGARRAPLPRRDLPSSEILAELANASLGTDPALSAALRRALAAPTLRLIEQDDDVRAGEDPEAVHQARVATRRLRANLGTLRPLLDAEAVERLRAELSWLGGALGDVRDLDVLLVRLRAKAQRLESRDAHAAKRLIAGLAESRAEAQASLLESWRSPRRDRLLRACERIVRGVPDRDERAVDAFGPLMERQWQRLRRACERLTPDSPDSKLHAARIATKRARYAAEAFAPAYEDGADRFLRRAAALQEVFGEHQDAVASQEWLRRKVSRGTPSVAFVAGELAAAEARARADARRSWPAAWRSLARPGARFWT